MAKVTFQNLQRCSYGYCEFVADNNTDMNEHEKAHDDFIKAVYKIHGKPKPLFETSITRYIVKSQNFNRDITPEAVAESIEFTNSGMGRIKERT